MCCWPVLCCTDVVHAWWAARDHKEAHVLALAEAADARTHHSRAPKGRGDPHDELDGARDFVRENMKQAGQPARRPRSAATLHHLSEPKLQPLSKIMKVVQGLLRRNANSGSRLLDVSNFRMGEDAAQYIASLLPSLSLQTLKLSNCSLTDGCMKHLCRALLDLAQAGGGLDELFLGVNQVSAAGVELLCDWLQRDEELTVLDLQLNRFGPAASWPLAAALGKNCTLRAINLQGNGLNAESVAALADALAQNEESCLEELLLGFNPIGDDGVHRLWGLVAGSAAAQIHTLCLCKCDVTDVGAKLMLQAASAADSPLRRVDLSYNAISEPVMAHFQRRKLQWVNLASAIDVAVPGGAGQGEPVLGVCDARLMLSDGPLNQHVSEIEEDQFM